MATAKSNVQFNISAKDQTAAAFASVRRGLDSLNRSANQLKALFAGVLGGATLAKGIRELIAISAETEPVKSAFDRLSTAMRGFAQEIGNNGVNSALVYFSDRLGAMVYGTDGLAKSIGALLGGGIRVLASVFEGVGRAIAFAYDNLELLGRYLTLFGIAIFAQKVVAAGAAFIYFAKAVRATGIIMAALNAVSRVGLMTFLALAAGVAYATDSVDKLKAGVELLWSKVQEIMPQLGKASAEALEGLGFDLSAVSDDLANTSRYIDIMDARSKAASTGVEKLGKSSADTAVKIKGGLNPALKETGDVAASSMSEVSQTVQSSFSTAVDSLVSGTASVKEAFRDMTQSILQNVIKLFANQAFNSIFGMVAGAFGGGAVSPMGSFNFGGPRAAGGPISAGKTYLVGEKGPELFRAGTSGAIIPNRAMGGGGTTVNVYNQGGGDVQQRKRRGSDGREILDIIVGVARQEQARGAKRLLGGGFGLSPQLTQR
jgi:hypothetical protein